MSRALIPPLQLTYPLDTLRLRLAVDPALKGLGGAVKVLLREGGSASFYRGLGASMLGECRRTALLHAQGWRAALAPLGLSRQRAHTSCAPAKRRSCGFHSGAAGASPAPAKAAPSAAPVSPPACFPALAPARPEKPRKPDWAASRAR